ncbi:TetR/AcrR family transcriptional regulator [Kineococcus sp. TRM81007]|uniref:TetR/AcrR family transcriptional regulator n=1 Tax=Kineococcus sp. TRM81007 TaxID=2925831 RepID=UPI001F56A15F|nr:TetR/AcrR family transcriptional regulator [Kineococcus sp. TRM81007]MCI2240435.1 TetR/AcrR family transcriptional regulator [Kineococcus sp. TRM81007]
MLDATAQVVAEQGVGVSLDAVAQRAGVSKSGLLHHFRSRDLLLLSLAEDLVEQFRAAVHAAIDPRDHARGRLVRGYVNATFDELIGAPVATEHALVIASLAVVPGVSELLREDTRRWGQEFADDGLHPQRVTLILRASDGAGIAGLYEGVNDAAELESTRQLLLALSRTDGPLVEVDVEVETESRADATGHTGHTGHTGPAERGRRA